MIRPRLHPSTTAGAGPGWIVGVCLAAIATASAGDAATVESRRIGGLRAEIAALIVSGQEGGEIDLAVTAAPALAGGEEAAPVDLWVEARGETIFPNDDGGRLEIYAYAVTPTGGVADALLETIVFDEAEALDALRRAGLQFAGRLHVPPGSYSLRVLLREVGSGRMGARTAALEVPDPAQPTPRLLTPSTTAPSREWYRVTPAGTPPPEVARTAHPVLPADETVALNATLVAGADVDTTTVEILAGETTFDAELAARQPGAAGEEITVHFDSAALAPGWHELRIRLPAADLTSPPVLALVAAIEEPTSWVALDPEGQAVAAPSPVATAATTRRQRRAKLDRETEGAAYRAVLAKLSDDTAESPEREADRMLRDFERRVLRENSADVLPELERVESEVAELLSKREPRALAPIILLHRRAYEHYFERREFLLSTFSRRTLVRLGNLYLKRVGEHPAKVHGAEVFTSLGAELQSRDHGRLAVEMFKRALEVDPGNLAAQIGLAMTYERGEAYEDAIYVLKQILDRDPDAWESRLRLALCELRIDRRTAGIRNLRRVIAATDAPAWVRTVAYQELARWLFDREEYSEASELLEDAVVTLPFDTQIRVLLAYAHDVRQEPWSAREVLAERPADGEETVTEQIGDSPRRYYAERENSGLRATRERLRTWDAESRPYLARHLAETAREESSR